MENFSTNYIWRCNTIPKLGKLLADFNRNVFKRFLVAFIYACRANTSETLKHFINMKQRTNFPSGAEVFPFRM